MKRTRRTGEGVRVLINALHAKSGGGVTYLRNMLPRLAEDPRLELHLFLHESQYELFNPVDERVRLHVLEFAPGLWSLLIWEQISLPIVARVMSADVTFSPANFGPLFAPNPVIVLRNALAVAGTERRLTKRLYWAGLGLMTAISLLGCRRAIAVSDYARRMLTFRLPGRVARKVSVVHHGVDERFAPGSATPGETPYLLAVADIYVQKNLHTLITALPRIHAEFPQMVLKIAGQRIDEGYYRTIEEAIRRRGLGSKVEFLGQCTAVELVRLYRGCAAFVFPSTVETFGNPLAEAMACGAPIASANTAAMPEVVGDAAVLFDPLDAEAMADAVLRILRDPALARALSQRGLERARSFSWERTARRTADVLVDAAGDGAASRHPQVLKESP